MKVIIAYDGSTYADAALDDLRRAGFPRDSEILVASVADTSIGMPMPSEFDMVSAASRRLDAVIAQARQHEARVLKETEATAANAVDKIRQQFPEWNVWAEVLRGDPAEELLRSADEWNADLIMGGSQGRSAIGRFFLGSVSKSVADRTAAAVRVARPGFEKPDSEPIEIVLGAKNPAEAERLVEAVGRRVWPADARMRLVAVDGGVAAAGGIPAYYADGKSIYESAAERLTSVCLQVSVEIASGDPTTVFFEAADAWRADAIFVTAGNTNQSRLDNTASALVTRARCTVEIVR